MTHLHVFAINEPVAASHTNLSRQKGEAPALPPLRDWLAVEALDTDRIELFPLSDLGGLALSDYVRMAFAPEDMPRDVQARIDALEGSVLLVPEVAMEGAPKPAPQVTHIAALPLAQPDHDADLPAAKLDTAPTVTPGPARQPERAPPIALYAFLAILVFAAIVVLFGWR